MAPRGSRIAAALLAVVAVAGAAPASTAAPGAAPGGRPGNPAGGPTGDPARASSEPKAPEEFVALRRVAPTVLREIRYATAHTFTGAPVEGYEQPLCLLTEDTAKALRQAQRSLLQRGYSLKVYDCYRPQRSVDSFVDWAKDLEDQRMKEEFYPRVDKSRLFEDGYIAEQSGHSRGSTVDLTVVKLPAQPTRPYVPGEPLTPCHAPRAERFPDNSLDMGTGYDCFDTLSHTLDPRVTGEQRENRLLLKDVMEDAGFENYPKEWWHYTYQPETFPDRYFDFPVHRRSLAGH
ncbi:M15 family metallopeptidase [Streptomyces oceani]|uniref:D-alanyl-D-alanine dipeptidase n=1 Tax=Streptomyces oceani TaxID=1075402 RepID=A0A1E7JXR5_9ACTN|nr:M15 family metallopeptidase [Streptomyces oceani]OEU96446.1 D-alanyl-D-alanine dipeptidase [Streptomyces oceani]